MGLDGRLATVAALVPRGARAADIGTDHAYLARALLLERGAARVIATDKNKGPCEAARRTLRAAGLAERIPVRRGDGLVPIAPGEVDVACIAGMGGRLIAAILAASPDVLASLSRLVLQPMNEAASLRQWLYANGWHIAEERLAEGDGRLYEILAAEPGAEEMPAPCLLALGPVLCRERPLLFVRHIEAHIARLRRVADGMARSTAARGSGAHLRILEELREMEDEQNGDVSKSHGAYGTHRTKEAGGGLG